MAIKNIIIGTAGHVDHGKTTLIKALTGINTDRLKEEQQRGLTIDLGFAHLLLPSGIDAGIVDVPGHERFLKNMLAGASGVDIALFVIAADEGIMPQTIEHLQILQLLDTKSGVVALTKSDTVDDEWLQLVEEDIRKSLKDTFLETSKIIRCSGITQSGVPELISELNNLAIVSHEKRTQAAFKLAVDRVFTMQGFGTVVTGTLASGTLKVGETAIIQPEGLKTRIRQLQVHGVKQDQAFAGSRVAVNVVGVEVSDINRGDVLIPPLYLHPTNLINASVKVLSSYDKPLKNRNRVRVHIGTAEILARVKILASDSIEPGNSGFIQLRLEKPIVCERMDKFVLRLYSPAKLLGGGIVLESMGEKVRAKDKSVAARLEHILEQKPEIIIDDLLNIYQGGLTITQLSSKLQLSENDLNLILGEMENNDLIKKLQKRFIKTATLMDLGELIKQIIEEYHLQNPSKPGVSKIELNNIIGSRIDDKGLEIILSYLTDTEAIKITNNNIKISSFSPMLSDFQQQAARKLLKLLKEKSANPPLIPEIKELLGKDTDELIEYLINTGDIVKVNADIVFHKEVLANIIHKLCSSFIDENGFSVADFRDMIETSRKYAVPILEYLDSIRITVRKGDVRFVIKKAL